MKHSSIIAYMGREMYIVHEERVRKKEECTLSDHVQCHNHDDVEGFFTFKPAIPSFYKSIQPADPLHIELQEK